MIEATMIPALALAGLLAATAASGAEADHGPEPGSDAPGFTLAAVTDGTEHGLAENRGERPVVLVFFRGAG